MDRSIEEEILQLMKEHPDLGRFSTISELRKDKNYLEIALVRYYSGGFLRRDLGHGEDDIKPRGYWRDFNNLQEELKKVIDELGHFPSKTEMKQLYQSLAVAIERYHGGLPSVRKKLGYEDRKGKP